MAKTLIKKCFNILKIIEIFQSSTSSLTPKLNNIAHRLFFHLYMSTGAKTLIGGKTLRAGINVFSLVKIFSCTVCTMYTEYTVYNSHHILYQNFLIE